MEKSLKDCLNEAADLIEQKGWCRGSFGKLADGTITTVDVADNFCMYGALIRACPDTAQSYNGSVELVEALGFENRHQLFKYNDKLSNAVGQKRVAGRLRRAAATLPDDVLSPVNCA